MENIGLGLQAFGKALGTWGIMAGLVFIIYISVVGLSTYFLITDGKADIQDFKDLMSFKFSLWKRKKRL